MSTKSKNLKYYQSKFGQKIREHRHKAGISQSKLAADCNMEKTSISRIETGRVNITLKTILILSKGLNIPLNEMLNFDNNSKIKQ